MMYKVVPFIGKIKGSGIANEVSNQLAEVIIKKRNMICLEQTVEKELYGSCENKGK